MDKDNNPTHLAQLTEALVAAEQSTPNPNVQPGQVVGVDGETITLDQKVGMQAAPKFSKK